MLNGISDDPVGIAAALIERKKAFIVALAIGPRGRADAGTEAMAIFAVDGSLLAGRIGGPRAGPVLAQAAVDCFRQRAAAVIDVEPEAHVPDAFTASDSALRVYVEPVMWTVK